MALEGDDVHEVVLSHLHLLVPAPSRGSTSTKLMWKRTAHSPAVRGERCAVSFQDKFVDACLVIIGRRWPASFLNKFVDAYLVAIGERWPV